MPRNVIVFKIKCSRKKKEPPESVYALQYLAQLAARNPGSTLHNLLEQSNSTGLSFIVIRKGEKGEGSVESERCFADRQTILKNPILSTIS
jgi:hypothetical protein